MDESMLSPAEFIEKSKKRFSLRFALSYEDYLSFNRFLFHETGWLDQSKKRMRFLGIGALIVAVVLLAAMLILQLFQPVILFCAGMLALGGILALCYYPFIFPPQFERSIRSSYRESGYMDQEMWLDFYDDGLIDRSVSPPAAALWEDVHGFFESEGQFLFLMAYNQAVVVPKNALDNQEEFSRFAEDRMKLSEFAGKNKEK